MKYVEFKKFTDENGACPIYLFEGEEVYFHEKGFALLKERFLQEPTLDYVSFDGGALKGEKLKALADAVRCFPFISQKRFVKITEFYPSEKDYEQYIKPLFETPSTHTILMIVNTSKAKKTKDGEKGGADLSKKPSVTYVDCARSDEETIKKWIYLTCKRAGVYADGITCGKIVSYCVGDMSRVAKETEKLLSYCEAQKLERITDELVDLLVYPDADYKIFELANALARKNYSEYMKIIKELTSRGFNETALLSSLASYFKGLYEVSVCKGSDREVAIALGMKEYPVKKNREQAAKFTKTGLLSAYQTVYGAISGIKCGELTSDAALKSVTMQLFFEKK
ncbi:MAG: DNA polymerase III subunit delta [Clostridiales bacterium]|nr:DNA polymerase III subunit delta [Clostridiales bacterium]MBQ2769027.1 DNA polymerase III subunit delta [Clostridia bacterium]